MSENPLAEAIKDILVDRLMNEPHRFAFRNHLERYVREYLDDENRLDEILALIDSMEHDLAYGRSEP